MSVAAPSDVILPRVSVLLAAWNEAAGIERCLDTLVALDWPDMEIVVCAGGTDDTLERARRYEGTRLKIIEQAPGEGKQAALRRCLAASSGEVIYLTDADTAVPSATFRALLKPIVSGEAEVVTGTCRPHRSEATVPLVFYQWSIDRAVERGHGPVSDGLLGRNAALTRRALLAVDGFGPEVRTGTDYHLARRLLAAGYTIHYVSAAVETEYADAPAHLIGQRSRWLRNLLLHGRTFDDRHGLLATLRTIGLSAGMLLWPLSWPWTRLPGVLAWLAGLAYLTRVRLGYGRALAGEVERPLPAGYALRLPAFVLLDAAASLWSVREVLSRSRRWTW